MVRGRAAVLTGSVAFVATMGEMGMGAPSIFTYGLIGITSWFVFGAIRSEYLVLHRR